MLGPWSTFFSPANGNCVVQLVSVVHWVNEKCMLIHSRHLAQRRCHFPDYTVHLGPDKTEPFVVFFFFSLLLHLQLILHLRPSYLTFVRMPATLCDTMLGQRVTYCSFKLIKHANTKGSEHLPLSSH